MFNQDITPYQNLSILLLVSFVLQSMLMPVLLTGVDGPEGWISVLIAALNLIFAIKAVNKAMKTYDEDTIISVSDKVFPKFISKLIGIYYIFMFLTVNSLIMKDFAEQVKLMMMFRTPLSTVIVAILLTAAYAAKKGIHTIANITNIVLLTSLIPYLLIIIFSTYYADYSNIFPVYPPDMEGILKSVPNAALSFLDFLCFCFQTPGYRPREKTQKLIKGICL